MNEVFFKNFNSTTTIVTEVNSEEKASRYSLHLILRNRVMSRMLSASNSMHIMARFYSLHQQYRRAQKAGSHRFDGRGKILTVQIEIDRITNCVRS